MHGSVFPKYMSVEMRGVLDSWTCIFYERVIVHQSMETQLITRYETMDCLTVYFINTNISQLLQHVIIVNTDTNYLD